MHLTLQTDYSLRLLMRLALHPAELATTREIARIYRISEHHLTKVAHQLGLAGYVETVRGHGGGLRLAKPPSEINIGDVIRRTEPDFHLVGCLREPGTCVIEPACVLSGILSEALDAFLTVLGQYTLADLAATPRPLAALLSSALPQSSS